MTTRFNRNQDTPLTCIFASGFEYGDDGRDGWGTFGTGFTYGTSSPHQRGSDGGAKYLNINGTGTVNIIGKSFPTIKEAVYCYAIDPGDFGAGSPTEGVYVGFTSSSTETFSLGTTENGRVRLTQGDYNDTEIDTTAALTVVNNDWNWLVCRFYHHDSAGEYDVWLQTFANKILTGTSADTKGAAGASIDAPRIHYRSVANAKVDDYAIFARSMYYTGGAGGGGAPVVGNTLTGSPSGATAVIDYVDDDGAGNGVVFVHSVSGAFASATDSLSDGSGWTASPSNDLDNTEASVFISETFMELMRPASDVTANWTSSTGANHYTEVDDDVGTADYVSTATASQLDEFSLTNVLPTGASPLFVQASTWGRQQGAGSVENISLGINDTVNVGTDDGQDVPLPTSFDLQDWIWVINPVTGNAFTKAEVDGLNIRLTSKA